MAVETCPHCQSPVPATANGVASVVCASCGSEVRFEPERTRTIVNERQQLGRFGLVEQVGSGAFGIVWKARDPELGRLVAVKIPHRGHLISSKEVERFLREARSTAQLRHPGIVSIHEVGQFEGLPYLVSDFIDGVTLSDLLTAQQVGLREAAELVIQIAGALDYAHSLGVVHRDVKPSNLMLERSGVRIPAHGRAPLGKAMVMDFGLALRDEVEATMTQEGQVLGTPAYMSPEQAAGLSHQVDCRSDVYSVGVVLYQLLTGVLPFKGNSRMILDQVLRAEPPRPRRTNRQVPRDLETITLKCLAKEPAQRYATAGALATDLRRWLDGEPVQARPVGPVGRLARWSRRNPSVAGLLATLIVVFLSAFAAVTWNWREAELAEAKAKAAEARADQARQDAEASADEIRQGMARLNLANQLMHSAHGRVQRQQYALALADLNKAVELRPDHSQVWAERGKLYADLGLWDEAAADIAHEFALLPPDDDPTIWHGHALARLLVNDEPGYQAVCARMLEHFRHTTEQPVALSLARAWGLGATRIPPSLRGILERCGVNQAATPQSLYLRGMVHYRAGDYDDAAALLHRATPANQQDRLLFWTNLGLALTDYAAGRKDSAVKRVALVEWWFDQAMEPERLTGYGWPWHELAELQVLYRQARHTILNAPAIDHPKIWMARGQVYHKLGNWDRAVRQFSGAIEQQPNDARLLLIRARLLAERRRWDEADSDYAQIVALAPKNRLLWTERAHYNAKRERWGQAFADFNRAIDLAAGESPAAPVAPLLVERGRLYARKGQWDKVADDYAEVFRLRSNDALVYSDFLGKAGAELAHWDEAFPRVVARRPDDARLWIARGRHFARLGQWGQAATAYTRTADPAKPDDFAWLECLAALLLNRDTGAYEQLCRRLVDKLGETTDAQTAHLLARSCILAPQRLAKADHVTAWAKRAVSATGAYPPANYLHALGAAHYRAGQFAEAEKRLLESMERNPHWPGNAMTRPLLAMTYHHLGKPELARHWLDETDRWLDSARKKIDAEPFGFPSGIYPADWLIVQVLRREAGTELKSAPRSASAR